MATELDFGTVSKPSDNPFRRANSTPDDHPLAVAVMDSWNSGEPLEVSTTTPEAVERLLRKIARERDLGVRVTRTETGVAFLARKKRERKPKADEAVAADSE